MFPAAALLLLLVAVTTVSHATAGAIVIPAADSQATGQGAAADMSVLERFRAYTGQRTPDELTALFTLPADINVRQLPLIAISDGSTAVIIAARLPATDGRAISFSLEGATLISTKKITAADWELKALPRKGAVSMSLLVMHGSEAIRYPLTVAPQLPAATDLSPEGFREFLSGDAGSGLGAKDLNGDGRRDYLDDYIFTANFLAKQRATGRDKGARQQRAIKRTLAVEPVHKKPEFDAADFPDPDKQDKR